MRMAQRQWAPDKTYKKKFRPRDIARDERHATPPPAPVVPLQRLPPHAADLAAIAAAEIAHRLRFPSLYGLTMEQLDRIRSDIERAIAERALNIRFNKRGHRV